MATATAIGSFGTGQECIPEAHEGESVGSFAEGQAASKKRRAAGRFSIGQDLLADTFEHVRVGSFADGQRLRASRGRPPTSRAVRHNQFGCRAK
jgi:hypothetical protein